ncbi:MAG: metallophosphoesterase family protein [Solirubrobacteraceae bacterium]
MVVAVISDIHSNRHAFEAVLEAVAASEAAEIWCLGDLVGYGADPNACVDMARAHAAVCLAGNHDLAVAGQIPTSDFSRGASIAAEWTKDVITPENLAFLGELEAAGREDSSGEEIGLYHASPRDPVWEYVLSALLAELCITAQKGRVSLIGHSHVALSFTRSADSLATGEPRREGAELDIAKDQWLLNPGSVGQPRDGDPRAAWMLLDLDAWTARYRRTPYDVAGAAAAIRAARLPDSLAERLEYGQ